MIAEHPYGDTSGDVLFTVFADWRGIAEDKRASARAEFYSKASPACAPPTLAGATAGVSTPMAVAGWPCTVLAARGTPSSSQASGEAIRGAPVALTRAMRSSRTHR